MTLDTRVYVLDQVDVTELFIFGQRLLQKHDEDRRGPDRQKSFNRQDRDWRAGEQFVNPANAWTMANELGQGLPAILDISYRPSGPLRTPEQAASHAFYEYCNHPDNSTWYDASEPQCDRSEHTPACWAELSLDTAYSARFANGMGCGDLHAAIVAELGQWLTAKGLRWKWKNEFTGEIHDDPAKLIELVSGGFEASAWFSTSVLPAILGSISEGGAR